MITDDEIRRDTNIGRVHVMHGAIFSTRGTDFETTRDGTTTSNSITTTGTHNGFCTWCTCELRRQRWGGGVKGRRTDGQTDKQTDGHCSGSRQARRDETDMRRRRERDRLCCSSSSSSFSSSTRTRRDDSERGERGERSRESSRATQSQLRHIGTLGCTWPPSSSTH